jgi:hypothetical protein
MVSLQADETATETEVQSNEKIGRYSFSDREGILCCG